MNEKDILLAGAAKGEITPTKDLLPLPLIWVIDFRKVIDPLYVRVLALSNGKQQSLFITLDMTLIPCAEETMEFLSKNTGIPKEHIFLTATHTHGAPPVSLFELKSRRKQNKCRKWYEQIKITMLKTIRQAQSRMVSARYGYGEGKSYINVNRDVIVDGKTIIGSNFDRPSDKTLRLIRLEDMDGKMIALIVNYACHAVVMNGCLTGLSAGITGDIPGRTSTKLEEKFDGAVALWCSGAAGDQNPRIMTQYGGTKEKGKPVLTNLGKAGYTILEYLSDEHVRDIIKANEAIVCDTTASCLYGAESTVLVEPKKQGDEKVPYILRLWMLGDIAFQGISAEIVTSVGKAVRDTSPYKHTILVSHTTGYQGYVADDWEYDNDAFEVGNSKAAKGAAQRSFVDGFRMLFKALQ